eukprot:s159_g48.t1
MEPNPFWSDRQRAEHQLQALHPADLPERTPDQDLPPVPADEWEPGVGGGENETPQPVEDGRPRGRLGGAERDGRRSRGSAYGEWSTSTFQTPPSSWQTEGMIPRRPTGVLRSQGTMPTESEPGLPGRQGGGGEQYENVPSLGREMDTTEGNLRDNRKVNFRDTAMGSREPDGNEGIKCSSKAHTRGTRIPIGPPPEDDEVFVTPPLPPVPPFPEFEEAHAGGGGWGVMWKPVRRATELGPAWPKGYWEVPFHRRPDVRPDPQGVQHRLHAAHQEVNQRHQGDRYEVEIRQVLEGQDSNTQANVLAALAPMELHEKLAVVEVLGSMPMSLKTNLLMQGNNMSLWDRIAMFHGWAKRNQRGLDVVQELHERPGIAGLPVLDWMPHKAPPAPGQCAGDRASIHDHLRGDRASSQGHPQGDRASIHGHLGGDRARIPEHLAGDRASIPEHLAGDRASIVGHLGGDRAGIPGHLGGDRAGISGQPGGDRAGIHGHQCGDRVGTPGHLGGYQPGIQGHLGGAQMGNRAHLHGDRAFPDVNINNQEVWDGDQFRSQRADYGQRDDGAGRDQRRRSRSPQEALRSTNPNMPKLPAPSSKNASVEVTDWLAEIRPLIGDLSTRASSWWDRTMQETMHTYQRWLAYTPLERLRLAAPQPNLEHLGHPQEVKRLEQRATTLLLSAIPDDIKSDLISQRELWPAAIMYKILRTYCPGGWRGRTQLLQELAATTAAKDAVSAASTLRLWKRQRARALEVGASLPDLMIQVKALDTIVMNVLHKQPQASFRVSTFRTS